MLLHQRLVSSEAAGAWRYYRAHSDPARPCSRVIQIPPHAWRVRLSGTARVPCSGWFRGSASNDDLCPSVIATNGAHPPECAAPHGQVWQDSTSGRPAHTGLFLVLLTKMKPLETAWCLLFEPSCRGVPLVDSLERLGMPCDTLTPTLPPAGFWICRSSRPVTPSYRE